MPATRMTGLFVLLLVAGCAGMECTPPREPGEAGMKPGGAPAAKPPQAAATPSGATAVKPPAQAAAKPRGTVAVEPVARPETPSVTDSAAGAVAKTAAPVVEIPAKAPAPPKEPVAKKVIAASVPEKPAAPPPLDLASLEKRLRETNAIGMFTKLTLKNQVDDLVNRFRAYYEGRLKTTLAELRQPYELLILKVLALLQDGDPALASALRASREAIWSILSDPVKFSKL